MRIVALARNTFREAVRDKVLYVLLFFAGATILGSRALGWITIGQDIKIVKDVFLASLSVFGALIAIFVGTNLVHKEIDKRTIYTIICRPIARYEFIIGKYLGLAMLLAAVTVLMTGVGASYVAILGGTLNLTFFMAALLVYCQLLLITALSVFLSSVASPILGSIIVFCTYVLGHATNILKDLPSHFEDSAWSIVLHGTYYIFPNLSNLDIRAEAANDVAVSIPYVLWAVVYAGIYSGLLLMLAMFAFEDKDV